MLVFADSFDRYASTSDLTAVYTNYQNYFNFGTTYGRFGGGGVSTNHMQPSAVIARAITATNEFWAGFSINISSAYTGNFFFTAITAGGDQILLKDVGDGSVSVYHTYTTWLAGSPPIFGPFYNVWHWVDVHYKAGSPGLMEIWFDNVRILNAAINLIGPIANVGFGDQGGGYYVSPMSIDDFCIVDVTQASGLVGRIGDCRIATLLPTANAGPNNGTPSAGSNYACVNEAQYNTTNYVTLTNTTGQEELYTMGALPSTPAKIISVGVQTWAQKSDSGAASLYMIAKSGGVEGASSALALPTSWGSLESIFATDPSTSAAWTSSAVAAMSCGVKVV